MYNNDDIISEVRGQAIQIEQLESTISNLTDHKAGTDAVAIFAQSNPSISTITVENNKVCTCLVEVVGIIV